MACTVFTLPQWRIDETAAPSILFPVPLIPLPLVTRLSLSLPQPRHLISSLSFSYLFGRRSSHRPLLTSFTRVLAP